MGTTPRSRCRIRICTETTLQTNHFPPIECGSRPRSCSNPAPFGQVRAPRGTHVNASERRRYEDAKFVAQEYEVGVDLPLWSDGRPPFIRPGYCQSRSAAL